MSSNTINPDATIGLLGGGQLGRMFDLAARKMGYRVHTFEPQPASPAGQISDQEFTAAYDDFAALNLFAESVDVVTFEFENVPAGVIDQIAVQKPVHPRSEVLHICQNRAREKAFLQSRGYPVAPFEIISSSFDLQSTLTRITGDTVLKTADFGYDGKGQLKVDRQLSAGQIWEQFAAPKAVLEQWINHVCELSVVVARNAQGETSVFPPAENLHRNHILDISIVPARVDGRIQEKATEIALAIAQDLKLIGLLAVEFFLTDAGELMVNELAPRPHNSGHYSVDACVTSQFEQQLRAVCGWPFGSTRLLSPIVMVNLLGDLWQDDVAPDFRPILSNPDAKLHLYGKSEGRAGRKMGHFCVMKPDIEAALTAARDIQRQLERPSS